MHSSSCSAQKFKAILEFMGHPSVEGLRLADKLDFFPDGRRPQFCSQMKDSLIFWQMEDNFNLYKMEDELSIVANGRLPQYFSQWETTLIIWQMEDNLNI
jgi:hypothetical protein